MKQTQRVLAYLLVITSLVVTSLPLGSIPTQTTQAAAGSWSAAVPISAAGRAGIFPEEAIDSDGVIHMIYEDTDTLLNGNVLLKYSNNRGGSFSPAIKISGTSTKIGRSSITTSNVNGQKRIDVVYSGYAGSNLDSRIYHTFSLDGGTTWSTPTNVSGSIPGFLPSIHADVYGTLHLVYGGYVGFTQDAVIVVFYTSNTGSGWSAPVKIGDRRENGSYNSFATINSTFTNDVVTLHVMFMGQEHGSGEYGKWVYYTRKIGNGGWSGPVVRGTTGANYPSIATINNNVYTVWQGTTGTGSTNTEIYYSLSTDNGATWTTPIKRSNGTQPQSNRPKIANAKDNSLMVVWEENFQSVDSNGDIWYSYAPDTENWSVVAPVYQAPSFSYEAALAGSCENYHSMWHDASSGGYFRIFFSQTGPTTKPGCDVRPVIFIANITSPSPTTNATIDVQISNVDGQPNQMRYSLTPFDENNTSIPWVPFASTFSVVAPNTPTSCTYVVYVQAQNTETAQRSSVRQVSTVIDRTVQAPVTINSIEQLGRPAPNSTQSVSAIQPNAPAIQDPAFTRYPTLFYSIGQEPAPCAGTKSHRAENFAPSNASYPYEGYVPFDPFDFTSDSDGVGYNEQQLTPTVVVTDQLDNVQVYTTALRYDDDPPQLSAGGVISFTSATSTTFGLASLVFTATVTDDGYSSYINQPNAGYWGAWVLASNSATPPTPAQFAQYGKLRHLTPGSQAINSVPLVNNLNGQMHDPGARYIHVRFVDGAGNYSEDVLTSPELTLLPGFTYPTVLLPVLLK